MERITSSKNPIIREMKSLLTHKGRQATECFLVEGEVMLREATACGLSVRYVLIEDGQQELSEEWTGNGSRVFGVPRSLLESVCDTRTPQGICACVSMPKPISLESAPARIVALDGVQDPGNVGTIWRTADAAGFNALLFGGGCADPMSPKVQRAAMGSGFRVPHMNAACLSESLELLKKGGWRVVASDLRGQDFYKHPNPGDKFILVIGNEARGISDATREVADMLLRLPMRGGAESLNAAVAAGIMMYELCRDI